MIKKNTYSFYHKRIAITWAILNGLGFIMAYVTPFFQGGTWNP
mgnify:CR=1 FL=1